MTKPKSVINQLRLAAEWYAKHGYYVFPCWPGTKKPATENGLKDATTDLAQVRRWWTDNPRYNIGINCGLSGLLVVDLDSYKKHAGDIQVEFTETVTVDTAHHGTHYWYRMPAGKRYGNGRGSLPKWLDIRGYGGYVVAPPSVLVEDGVELPYTFAPSHKPTDIDPAPLPAAIVTILDAAQAGAAASVHFAAGSVKQPNLASWDLSPDIMDLIANGAPKGERSEASQTVITALLRADASADDIRAVFVYFAIGAKYREKGRSGDGVPARQGDQWLATSIRNARTWLEDHPPDHKLAPATAERLAAARGWARSSLCIERLRTFGVRRVGDLIPLLDALVEIAQQRRSSRIVASVRDIADRCAMSKSSAQRRLLKLGDSGLLTTEPNQYGTLIDLSPLVDLSGTLSINTSNNVYPVPLRSTPPGDFFADHRGDDAFTSYPYSYAIKRRQAPTVLIQSLGASGLLLWDALLDGGSVKELAEVTGLTVAAVRVTLKRYNQAGLLVIWQEGYAKEYELHPDAWDRLEERRQHMVTAGIGQLRAARNASDNASYAQRKLQSRMPLEPGQKMKLENRRDRADEKVAAYYEALLGMGIDPRAKVRPPRPPRYRNQIDHGEEWVSIYRPIVEMWDELAPAPFAERYRMMSYAGYEREDIDTARRLAGKVGRGPRHFKGFADSPTHSQSQGAA